MPKAKRINIKKKEGVFNPLVALQQKETELVEELGVRLEVETRVPDQIDSAVAIIQLNTDSALRDTRIQTLKQIRKAIDRIRTNDGYGICEECEEKITINRLKAHPWASLCLSCQEISDKQSQSPEQRILIKHQFDLDVSI